MRSPGCWLHVSSTALLLMMKIILLVRPLTGCRLHVTRPRAPVSGALGSSVLLPVSVELEPGCQVLSASWHHRYTAGHCLAQTHGSQVKGCNQMADRVWMASGLVNLSLNISRLTKEDEGMIYLRIKWKNGSRTELQNETFYLKVVKACRFLNRGEFSVETQAGGSVRLLVPFSGEADCEVKSASWFKSRKDHWVARLYNSSWHWNPTQNPERRHHATAEHNSSGFLLVLWDVRKEDDGVYGLEVSGSYKTERWSHTQNVHLAVETLKATMASTAAGTGQRSGDPDTTEAGPRSVLVRYWLPPLVAFISLMVGSSTILCRRVKHRAAFRAQQATADPRVGSREMVYAILDTSALQELKHDQASPDAPHTDDGIVYSSIRRHPGGGGGCLNSPLGDTAALPQSYL